MSEFTLPPSGRRETLSEARATSLPPDFIVLMGPPGVGKSHFGELLADRFEAE